MWVPGWVHLLISFRYGLLYIMCASVKVSYCIYLPITFTIECNNLVILIA